MTKSEFAHGSADIEEFFDFMIERHNIWKRRFRGDPPPWTDDEILQNFRFTNVFRELDKGTKALRLMLQEKSVSGEFVWNIIWYRLFNWFEHAFNPGYCNPKILRESLTKKHSKGLKLFTSAHMTWGPETGRPKFLSFLDILDELWERKDDLCLDIEECVEMKEVFDLLKKISGVGPFISYEIVCDLRWYFEFDDILTWCNVGPGAKRGLQRLGMNPTIQSCIRLFDMAPHFLKIQEVKFELREIEHSLCEFDKYQRTLHGEGRPKEKFHAYRNSFISH